MQITNIHRAIVKQTGWLNTSRPLAAEDLHGRIILLDFWTYCCINCMHVIPDLQYLEEKFGDDLTVIGVHSAKFKNERDTDNIRNAILRYGIHHPVVNDFDFSTWKSFGIRAWPTFILINPKGLIEASYSGEGNRAAAERDITALLEKYAGKINREKLPIALEKDKTPPTVLSFPGKLAADGEKLFVSDSGHRRIVIMSPDGQILDTIGSGKTGSNDGAFDQASFNSPQGVLYKNGMLYIADTGNGALRAADLTSRTVATLANKNLSSPWDLAFYPDEAHIAIALAGTHQLASYDVAAKTVSVIAGNRRESIDDGKYPNNSLSQPSGLAAFGGKLYFVDSETSSLRVYENGEIKTLIGTGLFDFGYKEGKRGEALMQHPLGLYADASGVYVADSYNHSIRRFDPATGLLSNYAGHGERGKTNGALVAAAFNEPNDLLKIGDAFYVADTNNNAIRVMAGGKVSTLDIKEASAAPEFSTVLPNAETLPPIDAAPGAAITLGLQKGWHINQDAPSAIALFDADKKPAASFSLAAIKAGNLALPTLAEGPYRLQATLYYCEDKEGAQCLIKSLDAAINVKPGGEKTIALKLN